MLYDSHMHTPLCRHATGEPEAYAATALARGLTGIIFTCHNPFPDGFAQGSRMYIADWPAYLALVERARTAFAGQLDIRLGLEADYFPGKEPWLEGQLASATFHHVLGSVHPHLDVYKRAYDTADAVAYQKLYFDHLARAAETKLFDTLSHPELVRVVHAEQWQIPRILPDIARALDRIARTGVALELNTSGAIRPGGTMNPGDEMLKLMAERQIPVVLGSDAHEPGHVAACFEEALDAMERAGYREVSFFLDRRRHDVPIEQARKTLRKTQA